MPRTYAISALLLSLSVLAACKPGVTESSEVEAVTDGKYVLGVRKVKIDKKDVMGSSQKAITIVDHTGKATKNQELEGFVFLYCSVPLDKGTTPVFEEECVNPFLYADSDEEAVFLSLPNTWDMRLNGYGKIVGVYSGATVAVLFATVVAVKASIAAAAAAASVAAAAATSSAVAAAAGSSATAVAITALPLGTQMTAIGLVGLAADKVAVIAKKTYDWGRELFGKAQKIGEDERALSSDWDAIIDLDPESWKNPELIADENRTILEIRVAIQRYLNLRENPKVDSIYSWH